MANARATDIAATIPFDNSDNSFSAEDCQESPLEQITKNTPDKIFIVKDGYTRMHPNLNISEDMEIKVEEDGCLIVF